MIAIVLATNGSHSSPFQLKPLEQPKLLIEMEEVRRTREAKEAKKQDARHKEPPQRKKKEKRNKPDEVEDKVEILSENHTEWEDIIGNGQLLKKVLRKGEHMNRPTSGDVCVLNIEGRLASNSKVIQKYKNLEVIAGEGDLIQVLHYYLFVHMYMLSCLNIIPRETRTSGLGSDPYVDGRRRAVQDKDSL